MTRIAKALDISVMTVSKWIKDFSKKYKYKRLPNTDFSLGITSHNVFKQKELDDKVKVTITFPKFEYYR